MLENLPPEARHSIPALFGWIVTALLARVLWHRRQVVEGKRKFWSWDLAWEGPTAVLMAVIGGGLAEYIGAPSFAAYGLVGLAGYLGPRGVQELLWKCTSWLDRRGTSR